MKEEFEEIFRVVPSNPNYEVSNCGRVRTLARPVRYVHAVTKKEHFRMLETRFLKGYNMLGYKFCSLHDNKKARPIAIHRLVAEAFLPPVPGTECINHIDGNKHNNRVDNLERCTNAYNHEHATRTGLKAKGETCGMSKLNDHCVHAIKWFLSKGISHNELAKAFKVNKSTITLINTGEIWKHIILSEVHK
jgi:hypothetical protein